MASTIVALATSPVPSALGLIRLSGPDAHSIAESLSGRPIEPGAIQYRSLNYQGHLLDDVVLLSWKQPRSFTGEDMVEFSCHGNPLILDRIIEACTELGAHLAEPGEFTRRAFLNGRMDLTEAEAVADLIHARSERALDAVRRFQQGEFGKRLQDSREALLQVLSHLEAYIDFPDEDIQPEVGNEMLRKTTGIRDDLDRFLKAARTGKFLRQGASVVLTGSPNVGKSSLMNALLEEERVLVSDQPGTTRDSVDAECLIEGFPVRLTDTAGLRQGGESLEQLGMERTRKVLEGADVVLRLEDGTGTIPPPEFDLSSIHAPVIDVATKLDLVDGDPNPAIGSGSSRTGAGVPELKKQILKVLNLDDHSALAESLAVNTRHEFHLREAVAQLDRATRYLYLDFRKPDVVEVE